MDPISASALLAGGIGLFGAGSSALSSLMSYKSAKKLQEHQFELNQKAQRNYWQNARYSSTSAGYNPLLALGSGTQGFSASSSGTPVDLSSGIQGGVSSALSAMQLGSQIKNIQADTVLKQAQSDTERSRQVQMDFQNAMIDVETHLKRKDLSTYDRRFYSNLYEQMQRAENYRANSAVSRMNAETNRMNYNLSKSNSAISLDRYRRYRDWGNKHPYLRDFDETVQRHSKFFNYVQMNNSSRRKK